MCRGAARRALLGGFKTRPYKTHSVGGDMLVLSPSALINSCVGVPRAAPSLGGLRTAFLVAQTFLSELRRKAQEERPAIAGHAGKNAYATKKRRQLPPPAASGRRQVAIADTALASGAIVAPLLK